MSRLTPHQPGIDDAKRAVCERMLSDRYAPARDQYDCKSRALAGFVVICVALAMAAAIVLCAWRFLHG